MKDSDEPPERVTKERRCEGGVIIVREDDPETGETVVRKYPAPECRHEVDP